MKGKYLITTDNWFRAPDGQQYKAAWGEVKIVSDSILGLKTNRMSANWFAVVGGNDKEIIIAGCQIFYAIKCPKKPHVGTFKDDLEHNGKVYHAYRENRIYIAE